jgi:hypothetical protein
MASPILENDGNSPQNWLLQFKITKWRHDFESQKTHVDDGFQIITTTTVVKDNRHLVGVANLKGLFFMCGGILFGRDGVAQMVSSNDNIISCKDFIQRFFLIRLLALVDIIQFLIFGTIGMLITIITLAVFIIITTLLLFSTIHSTGRTLWRVSGVVCIGSLISGFVYVALFLLLPLELLFPEWVFGCLSIHKLGFIVNPMWSKWKWQSPQPFPQQSNRI